MVLKNKIFNYSGCALLLMMLILPCQNQILKILPLFILIIISLTRIRFISNYIRNLLIALVLYNALGFLVGINNINVLEGLMVSIVWPVLAIIIMIPIEKDDIYRVILKIIVVAHIILVLYDLIFCLSILIGFNFPDIYLQNSETSFSYYENSHSRLNFVNLNSITFTLPIVFVVWILKYDISMKRIYLTIIILLSFILCILSGRRSLMLIFVICPIIAFLFRNVIYIGNSRCYFKKYFTIFLFLCILGLLVFNSINGSLFQGYIDAFAKAFDSDEEPVKFIQQKILLQSFWEHPILGNGFGYMYNFPGRGYSSIFELSYHGILANSGIIGTLLYFYIYIYTFIYGMNLAKINNDFIMFSFSFGYLFMLIANATNPVLSNFDFMLPFYLCIGRITYLERTKNNSCYE